MTTLLPNPTVFSRWSFTRLIERWMLCGVLVCLLLVMVSRVLGHGRPTRYLITRFEYKYEFTFRDLETGIARTTLMPRMFALSSSGCQLFMGFGERNYIHNIKIFDLRTARFSQFAIPKTYWNFLNPAWSQRNNKAMMFIEDKVYIANLMQDTVEVVDNAEPHNQSRYPLSPNFNYALSHSEQGTSQVELIDLRTHEKDVIYQAGKNALLDQMAWQWSSNERYVLGWLANQQGETQPVLLYDLREGRLTTSTLPASERALWSPDSGKILFIAQEAARKTLYLYDLAQNNGFTLAPVEHETSDMVVQWSPDSQKILVYHTRIKHVPQLFEARSGQRLPVQLPAMYADYRGGAQVVSWSPNSRWLLIRSSVRLYAVDTVGNVLYPLNVSLLDIPAWHQNSAFYYLATEGDGYTLNLASLLDDGTLTITETHAYPLDQTWAWVCDEAM